MKDTTTAEAEADRGDWEDEFTFALTRRGLDRETATACAKEALAHCEESGESLREAFGDPEEYADTVAVSRIPVATRARTDYDDVTMDEYWGAPLTLPAVFLFLGGTMAWIGMGLWIEVTVAGLAGTVLIGVAFAVAGGAHSLRAAGFRRASLVTGCAALVLCVPAAVALLELPRSGLGRIPSPALIAAALLLNWFGERLERPDGAERRALGRLLRRTRHTRRSGGSGDDSAGPGDDREVRRWLSRLYGLLRGRHRVRRDEARRLVSDARQHLEASGARPQEEFGDAERYALSLVEEGGAKRLTRKELATRREWIILGGAVLWLADADWPDLRWHQWGVLVLAVVEGAALARHYLAKSRARTATSPRGGPGGK
ncbi:hypothetical protein [Streptomyces winkii]|uniref:hypothetical protein n=1 Tax=Streptomyces winkii TaxID=3051178 RepID=UPI0028D306E7|nr:hypothetical protein [Streptomyces sp. DSM 40971]